jgi:2-polyprenyl-3-methyl-5-hydroxy-6-metoxy-1,4-benzoquinol methylase
VSEPRWEPTTSVCPACGVVGAKSLFRIESVPIHSTVLLDDAASALAYPRRDLELALCRACGLIFNRLFDPSTVDYSPAFEESQHFSETFSAFARNLAGEIAERCGLGPGRRVLEIGCGKGEFLAELCRCSGCSGIGIDPSFRDDRLGQERPPELSFIVDWFGPRYHHLVGDVVLCRHTLEHIGQVGTFIADIRQMIGKRHDVQVVFETPSALRILAEGAFWDVIYEHAAYFTPGSHARLFRRSGFDVTELSLVYGDQYIVQYASPSQQQKNATALIENDLERTVALAADFAARANESMRQWRATLAEAASEHRRLVLWGGGSKTVAFLTILGIGTSDVHIVDKNPFKQGRYLPGSGHRVMAPRELVETPPDIVVAMNPVYRLEIQKDLAALGLSPTVIVVGV